jgi:hypothetical protein
LPGSTGLSPAVTPVVPSPAVTEAPGTFTSTLFALAITLSTVPSPLISTLLAFTLIVLTDEFSSIIMLEFSPSIDADSILALVAVTVMSGPTIVTDVKPPSIITSSFPSTITSPISVPSSA